MFFNFFKTKKLFLTDNEKTEFIRILDKLIVILNLHEQDYQIQIIENIKEILLCENVAEFKTNFWSGNFWGGSGSVWEVGFEDNESNKTYEFAIIELINLAEKTNLLNSNMKRIRKFLIKNRMGNE